jgi:paraquat-inducible protein A
MPPLIACHECDVLQREPPLPAGGVARCVRCGALLYRRIRNGIDRTLAYTMAAGILFLVANFFPIISLRFNDVSNATTLLGAVSGLYDQHFPLVAALVLITTIIAPATELAALTYLLLPLRLGSVPRHFAAVFRFVHAIQPWGMIEVFVLGVLVSLVRLASVAEVTPGVALWSFGALMFLLAAGAASFEARDLWQRVAEIEQRTAGEPAMRARVAHEATR